MYERIGITISLCRSSYDILASLALHPPFPFPPKSLAYVVTTPLKVFLIAF